MAILSVRRNGVSHFYHHDGLGSTTQLSDASQNVTDSYVYRAFGEEQAVTGTTPNPLRFIGNQNYYTDGKSGLVLMGDKCYRSDLGRFTSTNSGRAEVGQNPYSYIGSNPTRIADSSNSEPAPLATEQRHPIVSQKASPKSIPDKCKKRLKEFGQFSDHWKKKSKKGGDSWSDYALNAISKYCGKGSAVTEKMIKCMVWAESSGDPKAKGKNKEKHTVQGLMQIDTTCQAKFCEKALGHTPDWDDPEDSISCGVDLLCGKFGSSPKKYGTVTKEESAYDCCMNHY